MDSVYLCVPMKRQTKPPNPHTRIFAMTRFALLAFALFTSACATDMDANLEDTTDGLRASLEDVDVETERASRADQRLVRSILSDYAPQAERYGCEIISVVAGVWTERTSPITGKLFDTRGNKVAILNASMQESTRTSGVINGNTHKSRLHGTDYLLQGEFDGEFIEADFLAQSNDLTIPDYLVFADWSRRGTGGTLQGVVVDCD
jgi:hypothetical protein